MNKFIISLLDSDNHQNIKLAAALVPDIMYKEGKILVGERVYAFSMNKQWTIDAEERKTIRILNGTIEWDWRIYGYDGLTVETYGDEDD